MPGADLDLNTPQTPLYDKSQVVYGLHLAKEAVRQADEVVLVGLVPISAGQSSAGDQHASPSKLVAHG